MTPIDSQAPSTRRLLVATLIALVGAAVLLVVVVLPAEYGRDPTGLGQRLGLDALNDAASSTSDEAVAVSTAPASVASAASVAPASAAGDDAAEARKALEVFGETPGQAFATGAVRRFTAPPKEEHRQIVLPPGKGAEMKATMQAGDAIVFHWTASAEVAVDMHGDRVDAGKDEFTTYWIEGAQSEASGQLTAPFEGKHGWYWNNRGTAEVTVELTVIGQYSELARPGG